MITPSASSIRWTIWIGLAAMALGLGGQPSQVTRPRRPVLLSEGGSHQIPLARARGRFANASDRLAVDGAPVPVNTFVVTSTADVGAGSLREAIGMANAAPGFDRIAFNIPAPPYVIRLETGISITEAVRIDGYSQPGASVNTLATGSNAILLIEIAPGTGIFAHLQVPLAVQSTASQSEISGLVVRGFFFGIQLVGASQVYIAGNHIGTNAAGTAAIGNSVGINLSVAASSNQIGGLTPGERNVISGNSSGVLITSGSSNLITGNYIGTNAAGTSALPNMIGVRFSNAGPNNTVGYLGTGNNIISGNGIGVLIRGNSRTVNVVGNCIGTDANCATAAAIRRESRGRKSLETLQSAGGGGIPNGDGIRCEADPSSGLSPADILIGFEDAPNEIAYCTDNGVEITGACSFVDVTRNQIHDNTNFGILISGNADEVTAQDNSVHGNGTGLLVTLVTPGTDLNLGFLSNQVFSNGVGNGTGDGVRIVGGGQADFDGNDVHDNERDGWNVGGVGSGNVFITGSSASSNGRSGVYAYGDADVTISNTTMTGNAGDGVVVIDAASASILSTPIYENGGLGIDLGDDGVTLNDVGDSDVGFPNFPVIDSAEVMNTDMTVMGSIETLPNESVLLQLFTDDSCDPSGHGEGQRFACSVTTMTDATGHADFTANCPFTGGGFVTGTATDDEGNTSEFSACRSVTTGTTPTPPALSINSVSVTEASGSGTTPATFTVSLSAASMQTVTVTYETANGSATDGDYTPRSGSLSFAPGQLSQTLTIDVAHDDLFEPDETFFVNLSNPVNATIASSTGTGTIDDDEPQPSMSVQDTSVIEGDGGTVMLSYGLTLQGLSQNPVVATFATSDGSATAAMDYESTTGQTQFNTGETSKTITVLVIPDDTQETNETVLVTVMSTTATITDGQATGTIIDDDGVSTLPSLSILSPEPIVEGSGAPANSTVVNFNVRLSEPSDQQVSFQFTTEDRFAESGVDYNPVSERFVIPPGSVEIQVRVIVVRDSLDEVNEDFVARLSDVVNAVLATSEAVATIIDDDESPPTLSIDTISVQEGSESNLGVSTQARFTVSLSRQSALGVTVRYQTRAGTAISSASATLPLIDYYETSGMLEFSPGETTKVVNVQIEADRDFEADETFFVTLFSAQNATIAVPEGMATIVNDDQQPSVAMMDARVLEGDGQTTPMTFTMNVTGQSPDPVIVSVATADGTASGTDDYVPFNGNVQFDPGETSRTITILIKGDKTPETDEILFLRIVNVTNGTVADGEAVGTIVDDDGGLPTLSIDSVTVREGSTTGPFNEIELLTPASFTVTLSRASSDVVTVKFATADSLADSFDYRNTSGVLTFLPGETSKTITVFVFPDLQDERDESFFVRLSNAVNATIANGEGVGTIIDDDDSGAPFTTELTAFPAVVPPGGTGQWVLTVRDASNQSLRGRFQNRFLLSGDGARIESVTTSDPAATCNPVGEAGQFVECVVEDINVAPGGTFTATAVVSVPVTAKEGDQVTLTSVATTELHSLSNHRSITVRSRPEGPVLKIVQELEGPLDPDTVLSGLPSGRYAVAIDLEIENVGDEKTEGPIDIEIAPSLPEGAVFEDSSEGLPPGWDFPAALTRFARFRTSRSLEPGEKFQPPRLVLVITIIRGDHRFLAEVIGGGSPPSSDMDQLSLDPRSVRTREDEVPAIVGGRRP